MVAFLEFIQIKLFSSQWKILDNLNYNNIIYKKNIYPPICKNITKGINQEIELNIEDFFDRKNDSNYFITFKHYNTEFIQIKSPFISNVEKSKSCLNFEASMECIIL